MNSLNTYAVPPHFHDKHQPTHIVGQNVRLSYLLENWQNFVDKEITVVGWARETRLQAKDTLLFVKLVDGSNA